MFICRLGTEDDDAAVMTSFLGCPRVLLITEMRDYQIGDKNPQNL